MESEGIWFQENTKILTIKMILAIQSEKLCKKESQEMMDRNLRVRDKNWAAFP